MKMLHMTLKQWNQEVLVDFVEEPVLKKPTLVEGLLGLGFVGKFAAGYLIHGVGAKKFADIYSFHFTPLETPIPGIKSHNGLAYLVRDELYYDLENQLVILTGDFQGGPLPHSYYVLANTIIKLCLEYNVEKIITLGGYAVGRKVESPSIYGVATNEGYLRKLRDHRVKISSGGSITGLTGVLLGLGKLRGIEGFCLLGETQGRGPDPVAGKAVLDKLIELEEIKINSEKVNERARKDIENIKRYEEQLKKLRRREILKPPPEFEEEII